MPVTIDYESFALDDAELVLPIVDGSDYPVNPSPFSGAGAEIAHELQRAGWDVEGIDVAFRTYHQDGRIYRAISSISGNTGEGPFRLHFGHGQQHEDGVHSTALSHLVVPPGIETNFFSDRSGPSVVLFLTDDWARDGNRLINTSTVNARLEGKPKEYIKYSGSHRARIEPENDSNEYGPEGDEPRWFTTKDLADRINPFLDRLIVHLRRLPSAPGHDDVQPTGDANLRRMAAQRILDVPAGFPTLYTWIKENEGYRLAGHYERDPDDEVKGVVHGNGWRLASLGIGGHHPIPERAYDGFSYAATDPSSRKGHHRYEFDENSLPVRIDLKNLNEIYVVDRSAFDDERARMSVIAEAEGRDEYTPAEIDRFTGAPARTMVPAAEYGGNYKDPVYLIGRRLMGDEARLMKGPITLREGKDGVSVTMLDVDSGTNVDLFRSDNNIRYTRERARRVAERAGHVLHGTRDKGYRTILDEGYQPPVDEPVDLFAP